MMEKRARISVYRYKGHTLVVSLSGKRMFVVESGAFYALSGPSAPIAELADNIRQALKKSQDFLFLGIDHKTDFTKAAADFLDLMDWFAAEVGTKRKSLAKELELVSVEQIGTEITFTPQKRDKQDFGFLPISTRPEDLLKLSAQASDEDLASAVTLPQSLA